MRQVNNHQVSKEVSDAMDFQALRSVLECLKGSVDALSAQVHVIDDVIIPQLENVVDEMEYYRRSDDSHVKRNQKAR